MKVRRSGRLILKQEKKRGSGISLSIYYQTKFSVYVSLASPNKCVFLCFRTEPIKSQNRYKEGFPTWPQDDSASAWSPHFSFPCLGLKTPWHRLIRFQAFAACLPEAVTSVREGWGKDRNEEGPVWLWGLNNELELKHKYESDMEQKHKLGRRGAGAQGRGVLEGFTEAARSWPLRLAVLCREQGWVGLRQQQEVVQWDSGAEQRTMVGNGSGRVTPDLSGAEILRCGARHFRTPVTFSLCFWKVQGRCPFITIFCWWESPGSFSSYLWGAPKHLHGARWALSYACMLCDHPPINTLVPSESLPAWGQAGRTALVRVRNKSTRNCYSSQVPCSPITPLQEMP